MSFAQRQTAGTLALLAFGTVAVAQYSTPVGTGAAKPKTLRATAVLEWTGSLEKPNASRLMPIAVWDGEHYQPAGLYLARPAPLAFETGTQYQLERSGEPAGLFNVRGAAQLRGEWIGMGKFQAQAVPPPPPKLKPSKHLPVLSTGKSDGAAADSRAGNSTSDRPTLHRKPDDSSTGSPASSKDTPPATGTPASSPTKQGDSSSPSAGDSDKPTLHRHGDTDSSGASAPAPAGTSPASTTGNPSPPSPSTDSSTSAGSADDDRPTLHRRSDTAGTSSGGANAPDVDPDRPTLHRPAGTNSADSKDEAPDQDRPTLHRAHSGGDAVAAVDPDRPHLRYGKSDDAEGAVLPVRLEGAPPAMQQIVAVSDSAVGDPRPYQFHWPSPDEATKMQAALAALAAQAVSRPASAAAKPPAQFGPASRAAARKPRATHSAAALPTLIDEHFAAYELSFSGGATLVYSAHTVDEGPQRVYVTLIAQPDFSGKPQVLLQQVARADRLDETPALQLVDAVDTDNDQRAELIFQLNGATTVKPLDNAPASGDSSEAIPLAAPPTSPAIPATATVAEREFAIYRVANGKAVQVFDTGPLP